MAERLGVDHQGLQQFVTSSTWDHETVRANVARWGAHTLDPNAYVVDDTGFANDGKASPLVARMYSGTLGKTTNCQIGVSVQLVPTPRLWLRTGGCTAPPPGATRRSMTPQWPSKSVLNGNAPACPTLCAVGRSGAWLWTCSTR
jgi:hypothetical protein